MNKDRAVQISGIPTADPVPTHVGQHPMGGRGGVGFKFRFPTKVGLNVGKSFRFLTFLDLTPFFSIIIKTTSF